MQLVDLGGARPQAAGEIRVRRTRRAVLELLHRVVPRLELVRERQELPQALVLRDIDPPRAGAEEQVKQIAASTVPAIAYVSCNPASFARDARLLVAGGYCLDWAQPVGQFRWSTHVELAERFRR